MPAHIINLTKNALSTTVIIQGFLFNHQVTHSMIGDANVDVNRTKKNIRIQPNPAEGRITVEYNDSKAGSIELSIYNMKEIKMLYKAENSIKGINLYQLDLTGLPQAPYYLLLTDQSQHAMVKFIIRR